MGDKIYCGNAREKRFNDGNSVLNATIDIDALTKAFNEFGWTTDAGKRKIKVKIAANRNGADQYNNTHYIEVDTWKPNSQPVENKPAAPALPASFESDIPF